MKNYVYMYDNRGDRGNVPMEEVMKAWNAWFAQLGDKLVDGGNPFNDGAKEVSNNGVSDITGSPASGYSIVKAESMAEATELAKGCPMLQHSKNSVIEVYETLPM
ncbi:hypothetical protein HY379_00970 [Candidatus Saccharibacteria bacterium]|nr:hypothetical protein [Candidatus Saccharibacteria bacterium]